MTRYFFECGGCDHLHPLGWGGDCRDDAYRYTSDMIEENDDCVIVDEDAPMPADAARAWNRR